MAVNRVDWTVLRGAIGVFAICLLVGGVLLGASYYFREEMETEYRNHQSRFRDVSRKYLAVDDEERIIEQSYPDFVRLHESGILGQEHRLSWIEALTEAGDRIRLPELGYRINSQSVFEPPFPVALGAYDIRLSEMTLTLGLLHEGDLMSLLTALDENANGLYSVARCDGVRVNEDAKPDKDRPTISADCRLHWFTVDLKGDRELSL